MPSHQSAVSTLIREVLADPDLAHDDVFRRLLQAGLQDLVDAEAAAVIGAGRHVAHAASHQQAQRQAPQDGGHHRQHWTKIRPQQPHRVPRAARPGAALTSPRVLPDSESARPLIGSALPEQRGVAVRRTTPPLPDPHCDT